MKKYSRARLHSFARALGDTTDGLTGFEIERLLKDCQIKDTVPNIAKWQRLFYAFTKHSDKTGDDSAITKFIEKAMDTNHYFYGQPRYEKMREHLDRVLLLEGNTIGKGGKIIPTKVARLLKDGQVLRNRQERVLACRARLESLGIHHHVLEFCAAELAEENYFHAMLEAIKSISYKLRKLAKLANGGDGKNLIERALSNKSDHPLQIKINALKTESDESEQGGFMCLIEGIFRMFRNRIAHDARIKSEKVEKDDLEALLMLASLIHRRLDKAKIEPRAIKRDVSKGRR